MERIAELATTVTHDELLEITQSSLCTFLSSDSLLKDLPSDVIVEEILSQIAVEYGQSITVSIIREDEPPLNVIVPQSVSVRDLKKAISRHFEIYQKRTGSKVKISWKYIWKTYDLNYDGIILDNNCNSINEYGVTNKVKLTFKKRRKNKIK